MILKQRVAVLVARLVRQRNRPLTWSGAALAVLLITAGVALSVGASRGRADPVWERIQRRGVMRVGMDASFPPFETVDESGGFSGYDVDLAGELAQRLNVPRIEFVNIHFDGLYDALYEGRIDLIISALPFERERTQDVRYSLPYFHAGQILAVRAEENAPESVADLADELVAVEMGSEAHYVVRQLIARQGITLQILTTYTAEEALDLVEQEEAKAAVADVVTVYSYASSHQEIRPAGAQLTDEPYVIAIPMEGRILVERINEALAAMAQDDFVAMLHARWF